MSLLTSFTALQNDEDESGNFMGIKTNDHVKAEYYSLMVVTFNAGYEGSRTSVEA